MDFMEMMRVVAMMVFMTTCLIAGLIYLYMTLKQRMMESTIDQISRAVTNASRKMMEDSMNAVKKLTDSMK